MDLIDKLINFDVNLFVYSNGQGTETWDGFWNLITTSSTWAPLYLVLLYLVYRFSGWKGLLYYVVVITLLITVVDQSTTHLFKNIFQRLRPSHNADIADVIRITTGKGGQWGFISAHASNSFAIAIFLGFQFKKIFKYSLISFLVWATIVSYSRIYVGKHYPLDLICGAIWGATIAFSFLKILKFFNFDEKMKLLRKN